MEICGYKVNEKEIIDTLNDVVCDCVGYNAVNSQNVMEWFDYFGALYFRDDLTNDDDELLVSDYIDIGVDTYEEIFIGLWCFETENINEEDVIKFHTGLIIKEMLTESTGKAFMDSGDIYGRHWETNQKDGIKQGRQPCDFSIFKNETELTPIIPIFDYLSNTIKYTEECQMLEQLLPSLNYDVLHYLEDVISNPSNYDSELSVFENSEIFSSKVDNTYNYEDCLSQGFLYLWFTYDVEDYIAISIHNGCDIRGGYTDIHIFKVEWAEEMFDARKRANVYCKCGMHNYEIQESSLVYWRLYDEVNEKFVYAHSYVDKNKQLRCKYCNELITVESVTI